MSHLLLRYETHVLLDATYRTTKYGLSFFLAVRTFCGRCICIWGWKNGESFVFTDIYQEGQPKMDTPNVCGKYNFEII